MRRNMLLMVFWGTVLSSGLLFGQGIKMSAVYNYPVADTVLSGLSSIRAAAYDADLLGDGVSAIAVTNYAQNGRVHVFKTVGNDSIELVWSSPPPDTLGGGSTPRHVVFADLDGDGRKEVIYHSEYNGLFIYEWDGVPGSYNFGTKPAQQITQPTIKHAFSGTEYCEFLEVNDYDLDGKQELAIAYNSAGNENDNYYVISAIGNWSTDSPGFSGFKVEFALNREVKGDYGLGGSPIAMIGADLDGDNDKDLILTNWNLKNITPVTTVEADSFRIADTTNGKAHINLTPSDDVALMGGMAFDVDNDGRDEVFLPTYGGSYNLVHMIHYDAGESLSEIDSSNVTAIDLAPYVTGSTLGFGYGDYDKNGKPNIYITSINGYGENVVTAEFQGGDKTDPANWMVSTLYAGDSTIYSGLQISVDSMGVADTTNKIINSAFVANMFAQYTDFDKDGAEDMILPYQGINDSIAVQKTTHDNQGGTQQVVYNELNPKRWGLRIIESLIPNRVEIKDLTVITPGNYELHQNYPNPFNPETVIEFIIPVRKKVSLEVYDMLGQKVKSLISGEVRESGLHKVTWDGTNEAGLPVASGMYVYSLKFGNFVKSKRMTLIR